MPLVDRDYPKSYGQLRSWFTTDEACWDYLDWLRWPQGFVCPKCSGMDSWWMAGGIRRCTTCRARIRVTAGTIFQDTRTPLTVWFAVAWLMATAKDGVSAQAVQAQMEIGSYQTAWAMLHRFRKAMGHAGREPLRGEVEVDETFIGGFTAGRPGRSHGAKTIVIIGVEVLSPKGFGRVRAGVIDDASTPSLRGFLQGNVDPGAVVLSDGWKAYSTACGTTWTHKPYPIKGSGSQAHEVLPGVHRVASLLKRWLMSTHQGSVRPEHLQAYLDEFCFRFNRRTSRAPGLRFLRLMQMAVAANPLTYRDMVVNPDPKSTPPIPPAVHRIAPDSLERGLPGRPWRSSARSTTTQLEGP